MQEHKLPEHYCQDSLYLFLPYFWQKCLICQFMNNLEAEFVRPCQMRIF